jgi:hypothetical protein
MKITKGDPLAEALEHSNRYLAFVRQTNDQQGPRLVSDADPDDSRAARSHVRDERAR